jgi:hypothetical protein
MHLTLMNPAATTTVLGAFLQALNSASFGLFQRPGDFAGREENEFSQPVQPFLRFLQKNQTATEPPPEPSLSFRA